MTTRLVPLNRRPALTAAVLAISAGVWLSAQVPQVFQFVVSATDAAGAPVADLRAEDIIMSEDGVSQPVIKVEPLAVPMKLTIAVDNGKDSVDAIEYLRRGLTGLVEALPSDVEVALISTAPQPRNVVKATTDRAQLLRGINTFAPEADAGPKFTDTFMEYTERLKKESKDAKAAPYLPVLLMVSTIALDRSNYQPKQIEQAVGFLASRHAKLNTVMLSTRKGDVKTAAELDASMQAIIARPAAKVTNGRYELVTVPERVTALLTEWGRDLAALHKRQNQQFKVTVERERAGELRNPKIELSRPGLNGAVTRDGFLP
jgi:hypothetical protein